MDEVKIVYLVTMGEYSDYEVLAVFSDEQLAQAYAEWHGGRVEPYVLNDTEPRTGTIYIVVVNQDGQEIERRTEETELCGDWPVFRGSSLYGARQQRFEVEAHSPHGYDAALKAARDVLARLKAGQAGTDA